MFDFIEYFPKLDLLAILLVDCWMNGLYYKCEDCVCPLSIYTLFV